jgi:hypothetical protein
MSNLKKIDFDDFLNSIKNDEVYEIKKKRERAIYSIESKNLFFKIWVQNWTQSKIANYCFEAGFYDSKNANSIIGILHDSTGDRGYVQHSGICPIEKGKSDKCWDQFIRNTTLEKRKNFIIDVFEKSFIAKGTYTDLAPCNTILYNDNINFIDLESFRSFELIFENKRKEYENFELDAWWKPHETAKRDVNKYFKSYILNCLNININFEIDSYKNFKKAYETIKNECK